MSKEKDANMGGKKEWWTTKRSDRRLKEVMGDEEEWWKAKRSDEKMKSSDERRVLLLLSLLLSYLMGKYHSRRNVTGYT